MNKILAYNYWLDKGYKRLFSHNIEETIQLTFKKIIESFPDSDDIEIDDSFKVVFVFQCKKNGAIYLGWIHSTGTLPSKSYCLPSYQAIVLEENIPVTEIIEKLKRGPRKLFGSKNSTIDFDTIRNEEYFSDNENQFLINEQFIELIKTQKSSGKLMRAWSENPTSFIATDKSFGNWQTLNEKIARMDFEELKVGVNPPCPPHLSCPPKKEKTSNFKKWLKNVKIFTILAIVCWIIWIIVKPSNKEEKFEQPMAETIATNISVTIIYSDKTTNTFVRTNLFEKLPNITVSTNIFELPTSTTNILDKLK